jgi:hypothetical protein
MQGIHTHIPETNHVSRVQCRSYSAFTVRGAYNLLSVVVVMVAVAAHFCCQGYGDSSMKY